jgi:UrcA family protein
MSKFLFALAALAAAAAAPATASIPLPAGSRIVSYADLDLSSAAGRARLEQRIGAAVRAVCGEPLRGDLRNERAVRACRTATLARVVRPAPAAIAVGGTQ